MSADASRKPSRPRKRPQAAARKLPRKLPPGRIDVARLRRMSEAEIMRTSPPELADLPEDFWDGAELVAPVIKQAISLRVDPDVLDWFRAQGPRYQSRMNAVLRTYMTQMRTRGAKKRAG